MVNLIPILILMRPHQWVKNLFVAAPLFFTGEPCSLKLLFLVVMGVVSFCLLSSAVYIFNDLCDRNTDLSHPEKRFRPIAAGTVPVGHAISWMTAIFILGLSLSLWISSKFASIGLLYIVINVGYSLYLKKVSIIDVMIVAFGFLLRVEAGAILIDYVPSIWILTISGLLAVFLALAKRRNDLQEGLDGKHRKSLSGYTVQYLDTAIGMILGSLLVCYIIYTTDQLIIERLGTERLYLTTPFVFAGIMRYLQITIVEKRSGSPTKVILNDKFMVLAILGWVISFTTLVYF